MRPRSVVRGGIGGSTTVNIICTGCDAGEVPPLLDARKPVVGGPTSYPRRKTVSGTFPIDFAMHGKNTY